MTMWQKYGKAIVAFLWAVATVAIPLFSGDHHFDTAESIIVVVAIGNNLIVFLVPVFPQFKSLKTITTAVLAGVAVLQLLIGTGGFSGLDLNDWYQVIAAIGVSLGLWFAPAATTELGQVKAKATTGFNN